MLNKKVDEIGFELLSGEVDISPYFQLHLNIFRVSGEIEIQQTLMRSRDTAKLNIWKFGSKHSN
jgi:hypothetical protein